MTEIGANHIDKDCSFLRRVERLPSDHLGEDQAAKGSPHDFSDYPAQGLVPLSISYEDGPESAHVTCHLLEFGCLP